MNLNHLQYFLETCRYGSITKASEVCHISQPSITAAINNLEKELGAKLFDRVNNRLRLTVVGEGFKDLTEEFLKTFDDYCQSAYDIASSRYTKIRVGIPPFLSTIITKKLFPEFSVQHPNIRLEIVEVGLIDGLNKLNSSQLDCLIGVCRSKTFTCNSRCLFTTKLTLAVNRVRELVHRHKAISIAQMESIPLVTPVKGSYLYSLINEILASKSRTSLCSPISLQRSNICSVWTVPRQSSMTVCSMTMKISSISRLKRIFFWRPMFSGRRDDMSRLL